MAFDLDTYKRSADRLHVDDIDFAAFRDQPLAPEHLRCLRYMHDVENHTSCYLRNLLNTRAHHDPEITTFLTLWNHEEFWHGEALGRVLAAHEEPGGAPRVASMRRRLGWRITASPVLWMAFSAATRHFLAVHMTVGVINEWTTQAGYVRLAGEAQHPVLDEVLRRIMRQEGTHIAFYRSQAVERLEASAAAQRTTRRVVRALWSPVGASVMPEEETRHLVRTLFTGEDGSAVAERIDRRIDALPGLGGMGLLAGALRRYA
ncbi:MAG TPA: hypothetical protein VFU14_04590 [Acidimicrobiales bacterium]|nr:hypothetical protein [Acidimicrobiales bacterium]